MGQISSREYWARRNSHRAHSPGLPPSIHDISTPTPTGEHREPAISRSRSKTVQHVRTVGERRLTQAPWDGHKYEWRAKGDSWGGPEDSLPADDTGEYEVPYSGGYETPVCLQPEPSGWRPGDMDSLSASTDGDDDDDDDGDTSTGVTTHVGEQVRREAIG